MATRREFLITGAGITAFSGTGEGSLAAEKEEPAPGKGRRKIAKTKDKRPQLNLHLVGCGYASPAGSGDATRQGSAFLLEVGPEFIMVDCGPGTTYKMARMGISTKAVNHVFLTHHHSDHNVDIPCFVLIRWNLCNGKEPPLHVYGPPPTRLFIEQLFGENGAFFPDWNARANHPVSVGGFVRKGGVPPRPAPAFEIREVEELGAVTIEETPSWTATAARVHHVDPWLKSLAYRFHTDQGDVVFTGDCGDCPQIRELAKGADTLVIACAGGVGSAKSKSPGGMAGVATATDEIREIAKAAGVRRVVITHNGGANSPEKRKPFIEAVSEVFSGEVLFPDELTTIDLSR